MQERDKDVSLIELVTPPERADASASGETLPHVLLVLDQFPKTLGGGERVVLRLAGLLPEFGYRVSILTFFIHPESSALAACPLPCVRAAVDADV